MHGRIKVRTTAEQAEAKRKEREKKLKIYTETTSRIYEKRKNGEMDKESLSLSEQVLAANPDFSTLWNFRREIFLHKRDENPPDVIQDLCTKELYFLKNCLQVNPKSYGVWYHRQWIMEFMPQSNWKEELQLCNKFLSYDERNFHCWDYRRYTVQKANVSPHDEFNFSTEKIKENFSNYSSWHYRSKLLPLIHPDQSGDRERVEEGALMKEFDLAQNAYFTDPYDQSAWFYHRWLLGRARPQMDILCLYVRFLKKIHMFLFAEMRSKVNGTTVTTTITLLHCGDGHSNFPNGTTIEVKFMGGKLERSVAVPEGDSEVWSSATESHLFRAELTAVHSSVLQQELESCRLLLEEEPNNKWTMLTMVLLMRALDPLSHEKETELYLEKLSQVDCYRQGYYKDLKRKFKLENAIERHRSNKEETRREIDLSNMDLTSLSHMDQLVLMKNVNLCHNQLTSLDECNMLQCVRTMDVSNNNLRFITRRHALKLFLLEELSLSNNNITNLDCLRSLEHCTSLRKLDLRGNPCCLLPGYGDTVKSLLTNLQELDGEQIKRTPFIAL
ncbi:hypothetical protein pdam_00017495 [Pocillopora damicornis]|uniref:Geranylgeranyl transferase type-2 subunit alpha n=1 Tax=Pocillopora damicornis TaxID=46731 RepID=A0A3M6TG49_POCDA|nr:hypothetical protein pdam_00017495 [Pocillopora damicornis]